MTTGILHIHELPFDPFDDEHEYECRGHCPGYCDRPTTGDENAGSHGECPQCGDKFD